MKIFKPIYFTALAVIFVLLFMMSAFNYSGTILGYDADVAKEIKAHASAMSNYSRSTLHDTASHQNTVNYITGKIKNFGIDKIDTKFDSQNEDLIDTVSVPTQARYAVMNAALTYEDINKWYAEAGIKDKYYGLDITVKNIIVYIPGKVNTSNILFMAHYDSLKSASGVINNLGSVGAMLEAINYLNNNYQGDNGLLFVFTDGGEVNALGAYALKSKFIGFGKAMEKVKAGFSFDALGNQGPLALYSYSDNSENLIGQWAKKTAGVYAYSGKEFVNAAANKVFDATVLGDTPYLNFAVINGRESYNTSLDNINNFNKKAAYQVYSTIVNLTKTLGSYDLNKLSGVYFGVTTPNIFANIMGNSIVWLVIGIVAMVLLVAGVVVFNIFKKSFSFTKTAIGAGVKAISLAAACITLYVLYFIITGLLSVMGFISGRVIGVLSASNIALIIGSGIVAIGLAMLAQHLLKPVFKVKAPDLARGNILLFVLAAIVTVFFAPVVSSALIMFTSFELVILLVGMALKDIFKDKFDTDIDRLLIYAIPVTLSLPLMLGVLLPAAEALGAVWYPVLLLVVSAYMGFITPYFSYLRPFFDKIAKKLPKRSVRIVREVPDEKPRRDKKGKIISTTSRKIVKEKVDRRYTNGFGLGVVLTIGIILVFIFAMVNVRTGLNLRNNVLGNEPAVYYVKDSAELYTSETKAANTYILLIKDPMVYDDLKYNLDGYSYNSKLGGYAKVIQAASDETVYSITIKDKATSGTNEKGFMVEANIDLFYTITIPNANGIDYVEIAGTDNNGQPKTTKLTFGGRAKEIVLRDLAGDVTVLIKGVSSTYTGTITVEGTVVNANLEGIPNYNDLVVLAGDKNQTITAGIKATAKKNI